MLVPPALDILVHPYLGLLQTLPNLIVIAVRFDFPGADDNAGNAPQRRPVLREVLEAHRRVELVDEEHAIAVRDRRLEIMGVRAENRQLRVWQSLVHGRPELSESQLQAAVRESARPFRLEAV